MANRPTPASPGAHGVTTVVRCPIERRIECGAIVVHTPSGRRGVLVGHGEKHAIVQARGRQLAWPWEQVQRSDVRYTDPEPAA